MNKSLISWARLISILSEDLVVCSPLQLGFVRLLVFWKQLHVSHSHTSQVILKPLKHDAFLRWSSSLVQGSMFREFSDLRAQQDENIMPRVESHLKILFRDRRKRRES